MTDSVQAQLEAVLRGIEERTPHDETCARYHSPRWDCECDRPARVRAEQARAVERMIEAAIYCQDSYPAVIWAAALRAGEEHPE